MAVGIVIPWVVFSTGAADLNGEGRGVACLGRIAPANGILSIAQPASSYPGLSPIAEMNVSEGEDVTEGQVIAILENRARLETSWQAALAQAAVAESRLAQLKAGASAGALAAQQAEVDRWETEVEDARITHQRSEKLRQDAAISDVDFQKTQMALKLRLASLAAARHRLKSLAEVRDCDVRVAEAQYAAALAEAKHAKAEAEQAYIRAPMDGRIIKIHAHAGEQIGRDGVVEFAVVHPMYVIAEVYETDITRVHPGQKAIARGEALGRELSGVVEKVGMEVEPNALFSPDPASEEDARVVEVRIRLDQSEPASHLLNARVTCIIGP